MALANRRPPCEAAAALAAPETPGCAAHATRWVLAATVLASSLVFLEATVINVARPGLAAMSIQGTLLARGVPATQAGQLPASTLTVLRSRKWLQRREPDGVVEVACAASLTLGGAPTTPARSRQVPSSVRTSAHGGRSGWRPGNGGKQDCRRGVSSRYARTFRDSSSILWQ